MCLIKDGSFSPIRLFCHEYIETKRKSAKSDCVINSLKMLKFAFKDASTKNSEPTY